jgi:hypothetical protein
MHYYLSIFRIRCMSKSVKLKMEEIYFLGGWSQQCPFLVVISLPNCTMDSFSRVFFFFFGLQQSEKQCQNDQAQKRWRNSFNLMEVKCRQNLLTCMFILQFSLWVFRCFKPQRNTISSGSNLLIVGCNNFVIRQFLIFYEYSRMSEIAKMWYAPILRWAWLKIW